MNVFGSIGTSEILFLLILMVILLGPQKMIQGAKDLGRTIRTITHSQFWKEVKQTSREIRDLPKKIMEEADIEDDVKEIKNVLDGSFDQTILDRSHVPHVESSPSLATEKKDDKDKKAQ